MLNFISHPGVLIKICSFNTQNYKVAFFNEIGIPFPFELKNSVKNRQAEFLAGRYLANKLLIKSGSSTGMVGIGHNREPNWPKGFLGSISHTKNHAICAVARQGSLRYLGVDIETPINGRIADEIKDHILCNEELSIARNNGILLEEFILMVFSAKESLFKAIYPEINKPLNFNFAKVTRFDPDNNLITLTLSARFSPSLPKNRCFNCFVGKYNNLTVTSIAEQEFAA